MADGRYEERDGVLTDPGGSVLGGETGQTAAIVAELNRLWELVGDSQASRHVMEAHRALDEKGAPSHVGVRPIGISGRIQTLRARPTLWPNGQ